MWLCLIVCVHPISIDDPEWMVITHLVAVTKLVYMTQLQGRDAVVSAWLNNNIQRIYWRTYNQLWTEKRIKEGKGKAGSVRVAKRQHGDKVRWETIHLWAKCLNLLMEQREGLTSFSLFQLCSSQAPTGLMAACVSRTEWLTALFYLWLNIHSAWSMQQYSKQNKITWLNKGLTNHFIWPFPSLFSLCALALYLSLSVV